jgi:hypothetical protein
MNGFFPICTNKKSYLSRLNFYSKYYTDVLTFASKFAEIVKLKCLLMNENQISVFNSIPKPNSNSDEISILYGHYSNTFKLEHDKDKQSKLASESYSDMKNSNNPIDVKLLKMLKE